MNPSLRVESRPTNVRDVALPPHLDARAELHLEKLKGKNPSRETVEAICKGLTDTDKVQVLRYFLVESPLSGKDDLRELLNGLEKGRGSLLCQESARIRKWRTQPPRWKAPNPS